MLASWWLRPLRRRCSPRRAVRRLPVRRARPCLEALEERLTPSSYTVTNTNDSGSGSLRAAITAAVTSQDQNAVIGFSSTLAGKTITLSTTDSNTSYGPTAFVIANANITIDGANAPGLIVNGNNALRPFAVTGTGSLTLEDLTVEGGLAQGGAGGSSRFAGWGGGAGLGGAVYDDGGVVTAEGVTFTGNSAQGGAGGSIDSSISGNGGGGGGLGVAGQSGSAGGAGGGTGGNGGTNGGIAGSTGGFGGGGGGGAAAASDPDLQSGRRLPRAGTEAGPYRSGAAADKEQYGRGREFA